MAKGIFALEENQDLVSSVGGGELVDFSESPEAAMIEVNEASDEIETVVEGIEEASDTADVITEVADSVEKTIPEGGLSESTAQALDVAVEALKQRLGMPKRRTSFAVEGFASNATRQQYTRLAVEGWKETAKEIWTAIINSFNSAIKWVKEFITRLISASDRAKNKASKLLEAAKAKSGKKHSDDAKVNTKSFGEVLSVDGKVPVGGGLITKYEESVNRASEVGNLMGSALGTVTDLLAKLNTDPEANISGTRFITADKVTPPVGYTVAEGTELTGKEMVFGGIVMYIQTPVLKDEGKVGKVKAWMDVPNGKKLQEPVDIKPLSVEEVEALAIACRDHMSHYNRDDFKKFNKMISEIEKSILDSVKKASEETNEETAKKKIKVIKPLTQSMVSLISQGASSYRSYDVKVANAVLTYATQSLNLIK